jgi:hypothetical protein
MSLSLLGLIVVAILSLSVSFSRTIPVDVALGSIPRKYEVVIFMSNLPTLRYVINSSLTTDSTHVLTVTITNSSVIPKELFIISKNDRGLDYDTYARVASIYDIVHLKTDRTSSDNEYKSNTMSKEFSSLIELKQAYLVIPQMLQELVDYYKDSAIEYLEKEEVVDLE